MTLLELIALIIAFAILVGGIIYICTKIKRALQRIPENPAHHELTNDSAYMRSELFADLNAQYGTNWTLLSDSTSEVSNAYALTFYQRVDWSTNLVDWTPLSDEPITNGISVLALPVNDGRPMQFYRHIIYSP